MMITRREWHRLTFGALAAAVVPWPMDARYKGVTLGVQSYSFRDRPLAAAIDGMRAVGFESCELWQGHLEPKGLTRDAMRQWRENESLDTFAKVREMFRSAGIAISAYNISFKSDFSDAEIERGFAMTQALGAPLITASANTNVMPRVAPIAAKHRIIVAVHNHSRIDPNEFATPDDFVAAMKFGPLIAVNLDVGHFTAANFDAVAFLTAHHDRIVSLHIKDRKRNDGPHVPPGQGDAPLGPVLRLLRDRKWDIPANIEYEYKGGDTVQEVRQCLEFCRRQLDA